MIIIILYVVLALVTAIYSARRWLGFTFLRMFASFLRLSEMIVISINNVVAAAGRESLGVYTVASDNVCCPSLSYTVADDHIR